MPLQTIKTYFDGRVLYECEAESLLLALQEAVKDRVNLEGARLEGARLEGAQLEGAWLQGARLQGAKIDWNSHWLLGELLHRAARDDIAKRKIAGLVTISTDWCWEKFLAINEPLRGWALGVLNGYVTDGDNAPEVVTDARTEASS